MNALNRGHNYYNELGIASTSTVDEIKEAYRKLAREFHPDVNPSENARIKFANAQKAYQILSDAHQRAEYDMQRGILSNEEEENGFLTSSKKLREDRDFSPATETAYFINRHSKKTIDSGIVQALKSVLPDGLLNNSLIKKEWIRRTRKGTAPPERERVYNFSIDEMEALTGTSRTIILNDNGKPIRRELPIPPIDKNERILKIKIPRPEGKIGFDSIKIKVHVIPNPNLKKVGYDIYLEVPMLRSELEDARSMTVATTGGFETITLTTKHVKTPLILSACGLWDKDRRLHGDLIIRVTEVSGKDYKEKKEEVKAERERILFLLASLKKQGS